MALDAAWETRVRIRSLPGVMQIELFRTEERHRSLEDAETTIAKETIKKILKALEKGEIFETNK